mmetsp:Transcript_13043/g.38858  ORF Transcript_13043/g.38858 Transcript_13043/m.38858 type:complete len:164 (+) Transcript_13043:266-757(+)
MAAAKKTFQKLATAFHATPRWTLRHFRQNLQEGMDKESWKMMLPGVRASAQVAELKDSMKVLDALTPEELDGEVAVEGLRLTRVARKAEQTLPYAADVLMRYDQTVLLHAWLRRRRDLGLPEPETLEEATAIMQRDPSARPPADSRVNRPMRALQRRMRRRGY